MFFLVRAYGIIFAVCIKFSDGLIIHISNYRFQISNDFIKCHTYVLTSAADNLTFVMPIKHINHWYKLKHQILRMYVLFPT